MGDGFDCASRRGFTLIELMVVLGIIAVLASLSYPVAIYGSRHYQFIQCMGQGRKIGRGTLQYLQEGGGDDQKMASWMVSLEQYGVPKSAWVCPTRRRQGQSELGDSDFFYAGALGSDVRAGEGLGEIYLWVEKYPNHMGMHVCIMGDGAVRGENLLGIEQ